MDDENVDQWKKARLLRRRSGDRCQAGTGYAEPGNTEVWSSGGKSSRENLHWR